MGSWFLEDGSIRLVTAISALVFFGAAVAYITRTVTTIETNQQSIAAQIAAMGAATDKLEVRVLGLEGRAARHVTEAWHRVNMRRWVKETERMNESWRSPEITDEWP